MGLPHAFASHFAPGHMMQAIELHRGRFRPSEQLAQVNLRRGRPGPLRPPVDGFDHAARPRSFELTAAARDELAQAS